MGKGKGKPPAGEPGNDDTAVIGTAQQQLDFQHKLVAAALGLAPLPSRPHEGLLFRAGEGGTENYRIEGKAIGWAWCRAALGPDHADTRFWYNELITYLRGERHEFMGAEQCCDGAHLGMHAAGHAVPRLYAAKYSNDEILEETRWWWSSFLRIASECSTPGGEVIAPGCNIRGPRPVSKLWSALYRYWRQLPNPDVPRRQQMINDRWWTAYWAMTQPSVGFATMSVADILPRMRCPLTVERVDGGYNAYIDPPREGKGTVAWKWVCSRVEVRGEELAKVEKSWAVEQ